MRIAIKKSPDGSSVLTSAAATVPATRDVDEAANVERDPVGRMTTPVYDLGRMVDEITPESFHDDVDFGKPVGKETW